MHLSHTFVSPLKSSKEYILKKQTMIKRIFTTSLLMLLVLPFISCRQEFFPETESTDTQMGLYKNRILEDGKRDTLKYPIRLDRQGWGIQP